jgi:hypothetical protein
VSFTWSLFIQIFLDYELFLENKKLFLETKSSSQEKSISRILKRNYCGQKSAFG